jgi:hypothetical protein
MCLTKALYRDEPGSIFNAIPLAFMYGSRDQDSKATRGRNMALIRNGQVPMRADPRLERDKRFGLGPRTS